MSKNDKKHKTANGILIKDGKALLVLRNSKKYYSGFWDIPGGHIKKKETPEEALIREMVEEIGVSVINYYLFRSYEENDPTSDDLSRHFVFVVTEWVGEPENLDTREHSDMGWFNLEQLTNKPVTPSTRSELVELLS